MKRIFQNISKRYIGFCVILLGLATPLNAQVQITPTGTNDSVYTALLSSYVPQDFWTAIFINGTAVMDSLYVSAELPEIPGLCEAGWNMVVFGRSADRTYYHNAAIVALQKQCRVIDNVNNKKLYFTGQYIDASAGTEKNEGFIYLKGNKGDQCDFYMHNLAINTNAKTMPGQSINQWLKGYITGNASPIAIGSTSDDTNAPFTVNFHIRGENRLVGGATSKLEDTGSDINNMLADILYLSAAPISIRPIPEIPDEYADNDVIATGLERYRNIATKLTFDDVWPTSTDGSSIMRTNGLLELPVEGDLGAPSVDLGNAKGQVEFNGGQYKFHTPRTNSMFYVSSLAICYRSIRLAGFETIGTGSSMSAGKASEEVGTTSFRDVVFNDGTFSTYPAEKVAVTPDDPTLIDVVGKGWYVDYTDLRLPYNTRIYGGTFNNCNVYRCDGSGEQGVAPIYVDDTGNTMQMCRIEMEVNPSALTNGWYTGAALENGYGSKSLKPIEKDGKYYLYPYLVDNCVNKPQIYRRNWVTLIPRMGIEGFLTMGGDQEVMQKTIDGVNTLTNSYLFYARLNEYTKKYASISLAGFDIEVYQAIDMIVSATNNPELEFAQVTNEGAYTIEQGLYTMLSFPSNEWQLISFPYDVHRVWVLETTKQQFSGDPNNTAAVEAFLVEQGKADGKLAQNIVTSLCPDIFSGKGSGVNMNLIDIATKQIDCPPFELTHYNGSNANAAHYYLYEQLCPDPEDLGYQNLDYGYGTWKIANDYSTNWTPVIPSAPATTYYDEKGNARTDAKVLMKAGGIYNLFLPSGKDRYWDGKYLIFEGYGPQQILGSDNHSGYLRVNGNEEDGSAIYEGEFSFQGNRTFANFAIDPRAERDGNIFVPVRTKDADGYHYTFKPYEGTDSVWIHPGEVYGVTLESGIENVSMRGAITRRTTIVTGSTPVVGNLLLYAYTQPNGLVIDSRADQYVQVVSIDGRIVFAAQLHDGEQKQIPTTTGVYVVRSDEQVIKLLVP